MSPRVAFLGLAAVLLVVAPAACSGSDGDDDCPDCRSNGGAVGFPPTVPTGRGPGPEPTGGSVSTGGNSTGGLGGDVAGGLGGAIAGGLGGTITGGSAGTGANGGVSGDGSGGFGADGGTLGTGGTFDTGGALTTGGSFNGGVGGAL